MRHLKCRQHFPYKNLMCAIENHFDCFINSFSASCSGSRALRNVWLQMELTVWAIQSQKDGAFYVNLSPNIHIQRAYTLILCNRHARQWIFILKTLCVLRPTSLCLRDEAFIKTKNHKFIANIVANEFVASTSNAI